MKRLIVRVIGGIDWLVSQRALYLFETGFVEMLAKCLERALIENEKEQIDHISSIMIRLFEICCSIEYA